MEKISKSKMCLIMIFVLLGFYLFAGIQQNSQNGDFTKKVPNVVKVKKLSEVHYDCKAISSYSNTPSLHLKKNNVNMFLVEIFQNKDLKKFQNDHNWSNQFLNQTVIRLKENGILANTKKLKPTILIATEKEGTALFKYSRPIAKEIAKEIKNEIPYIKEMLSKNNSIMKNDFNKWSLFLLSNVLMDNWQINYVESSFLKESRPNRAGKYYYYAILENTEYPKEAFGIYGNYDKKIGKNQYFSMYGNNRNVAISNIKNQNYLNELLNRTPSLSKKENTVLKRIAENFGPKLVEILENNSNYIHDIYKKTGYSKQVSFGEFFIWWYHFIYTETTNMLVANGIIKVPEDGNFYYLIHY